MRSEHHELFREGNQHSDDIAPPRDAATAERKPFAMPAWQPWTQAAEAVLDWYGAMFRLAFGLGRVNSGAEAQSVVAPPATTPLKRAQSSPVAPVHSLRGAPVKLRPKRRKSPSQAKNGTRSTKMSGIKRSRRAA
jgi:hypothetical protein